VLIDLLTLTTRVYLYVRERASDRRVTMSSRHLTALPHTVLMLRPSCQRHFLTFAAVE